jgi:hypothetical protein
MAISNCLIAPNLVKHELERVLSMCAERFLHHYDIAFDRFLYRFDADGRSLSFSASPEDLRLSLNDFSAKIIEPAAAEFRGDHG